MTPKKSNYSDKCRGWAKNVWHCTRRMDEHLNEVVSAAHAMFEDGTNPSEITSRIIRQRMRLLHSYMDMVSDYAQCWADAMEDEQYDNSNNPQTN